MSPPPAHDPLSAHDPRTVVRELLAAAGGREYGRWLAEFERLDEQGCELLFVARDGVVGAAQAHPRDVAEDVWHAVVVAARRWPDRFLACVRPGDAHDGVEVLDALGEVDRPAARELLAAAARDRRAGRGPGRRYAMGSLIRLSDPRVPDLLVELLKDRDSFARFAAVEAAIEHGDARSVPALRHIADRPATAPGTREYALDAIEAIALREGLTDLVAPAGGRRLVEVPRPATGGATVTVRRLLVHHGGVRVTAGDRLAELLIGADEHAVTAPCDGVVVSIAVTPGREPPPIMYRINVVRPAGGGDG